MALSARSYQRRIKELVSFLESVQWVQPMYNGSPSCSGCGEQKHMHADGSCEMSKLLVRYKYREGAR